MVFVKQYSNLKSHRLYLYKDDVACLLSWLCVSDYFLSAISWSLFRVLSHLSKFSADKMFWMMIDEQRYSWYYSWGQLSDYEKHPPSVSPPQGVALLQDYRYVVKWHQMSWQSIFLHSNTSSPSLPIRLYSFFSSSLPFHPLPIFVTIFLCLCSPFSLFLHSSTTTYDALSFFQGVP